MHSVPSRTSVHAVELAPGAHTWQADSGFGSFAAWHCPAIKQVFGCRVLEHPVLESHESVVQALLSLQDRALHVVVAVVGLQTMQRSVASN
jgi:hypothetical protein